MNVKVVDILTPEQQEMRSAYCETLINLAAENPNIISMDADLIGAMGMRPFSDRFPSRVIDCGIQEANMIGVAAGLSITGKIPFVHSFGPFVTRRACDQVFMSGAYNKSNVKIVGSDPGITAQINGGTHMPFEDMGIMRGIPTMTVLEPTDVTMIKWLIREISGIYGMHYVRLLRKIGTKIYKDGSTFEIGKAPMLRDGNDATIIASGYCVSEALRAAEILNQSRISVRVLDMFCWKPIDAEAIIRAAHDTGAIVTAENHNVINGLGSAVAEVLVKNIPVPQEMIGVQDRFGQVGPIDFLAQEYQLTAEDIVNAVRRSIARKG